MRKFALIIGVLALFSVVACQRFTLQQAQTEASSDAPAYDVKADMNRSPANQAK
jgi:hypothetical protein